MADAQLSDEVRQMKLRFAAFMKMVDSRHDHMLETVEKYIPAAEVRRRHNLRDHVNVIRAEAKALANLFESQIVRPHFPEHADQ